MTHMVILGGGTAGTMAANALRRKYPTDRLRITVVDADDAHHYQPGYLFIPFGIYARRHIVSSRRAHLRRGIDFVEAAIDRVDADAKRVFLQDGREIAYDALVIATGTRPRPELTPGLDGPELGRSIHHFYELEAAERLAEALRLFRGGRFVVHIAEMPIKCPVAPLEFTFLADSWLRRQGIRERTELVYVTPLDGAFTKPVASRELADALAGRQIELETDFAIERVDAERSVMVGFDGREIDYDLLVTVPVNMGADYIARSGLGDESNYVDTDRATLQSKAHPDIFVLGDAGTLPTSKAGSVAHFATDIFVDNFGQWLQGRPLTHTFDGHANCFIETGDGLGMLLDFNYDTQPLTGDFPVPKLGPFGLLRESRANHWGKLAFRALYWHVLLPGRFLPLPSKMSRIGKHMEDGSDPRVRSRRADHGETLTITRWRAPDVDERTASILSVDPPAKQVDAPADQVGSEPQPRADWTREMAEQRAEELGVEPDDRMWQVIDFLRADYPRRGETATLRRVATVGGFEVKELFQTFPGKPGKKMAWIAGLPKPKGCV